MKKALLSLVVAGAFLSVSAQDPLFYTDFKTTPAGFKAASDAATVKGSDLILVMNLPGAAAVKDTVIDGCTLTTPKSSSDTTRIVISKGTQKPTLVGEYAEATDGRLGLKNSKGFITLPSVTGPCTITYHAGGTGEGVRLLSCIINDVDNPEAGIPDLSLNGAKATKKKVYFCSDAGPIVFKLVASSGLYIYDIKITAGGSSALNQASVIEHWTTLKAAGLAILNDNRAPLRIFNLAGEVVMASEQARIDVQSLMKGVYIVRATKTNERFTFVR